MKGHTRDLLKANIQQITFIILAFAAMVLVSSLYAGGIVRQQMRTIGEEILNTTEVAVSSNLAESEMQFANVAYTVESMLSAGAGSDEILAFLTNMTGYFASEQTPLPDFLKLYGSFHGAFLDGSGWVPPDDYVPEQRPWYIGVERTGDGIFFSEPYLDADTGDICISFSQRVYDASGSAHGILAMDLNLSRITDYMHGQTLANYGYGILVSDLLNFSAHRDDALVGSPMAEAGGDYARLAAMLRKGLPIVAERFVDADGVVSVAFFRTIFNNWHIGLITPRSSYYKTVNEMLIVLGALGSLLMLALIALLLRMSAAKMRADEESRSKSAFLSRMSHEMRTPMNAIIGMARLARESGDPERIGYCLRRVSEASDHLLGIINDLLDMSKIEAKKLELSEAPFSVADVFRQMSDIMSVKTDEKRQQLSRHIDPAIPPSLIADGRRLARVLASLLSNANKFTPEGGRIDLTARLVEKDEERCVLAFAVADEGIGVSPEDQARLFLAFEQVDGSTSRRYGGTGVGLAISKGIVEMMGGTMSVQSAVGKGSCFSFTITARIGAPERGAEQDAGCGAGDTAGIFAGKRILLAEDIAINREIVIAQLEETGVTIDSVDDGGEAVARFAADPSYDLVLMDIHMPEVDGYEATRRIRSLDRVRARSVPIVAMTANVFREDVERCLAAGMNDHLGKPIDPDAVLRVLNRYLRGEGAL